ncbi:hypothetical protein tinsulaeT_04620 [Thalassotalea insulae]|uniref:DUF4440 domain-containing protein n=1 Tax=Thalassotalea insulae TaxID=2056778 RepID=A0ABQ6GP44_9GAMM|nr:nuclear transport factor 2 family protein [Thalassotalea insulae]GLX77122.1 hypothetical protein tinsulaeT_04620 [Thalassotalea insulae]
MIKSIKAIVILSLLLVSELIYGNELQDDKAAITAQAKAFSQAFVAGDINTIMAIYSPNAKIVDVNQHIESDINAIRRFWAPNPDKKWQLQWHKTESTELIVDGNIASDIGYYSGLSKHPDGRQVEFGGAYVIVWRKIDGVWRMHLDMWNDIEK